jgi:PKD repeat protein
MATWTLTATGLPLSSTDADLNGSIDLTGAQPGDFNPDAITAIRLARTFQVSGLSDDTWTDNRDVALYNGSGLQVASASEANVNRTANGSWAYTPAQINGQPANRPSATGNTLRASALGTWAGYVKTKGSDGTTGSITAVTVQIDYTPGAPPVASFTKDKTTVYTGQQIQFTATSTGGAFQHNWDFGGGATNVSEDNPLVTFNTVGVFNVTVEAINAFGSNQSAPQAVTVLKREAEIWNGAAWVGGESWNGGAWVVPEVWDGVQWVPVKAP